MSKNGALPSGLEPVVIKRLGEAMHGVRGQGPRWIAVQTVDPYGARVFRTEEEAENAGLNDAWVIYATEDAGDGGNSSKPPVGVQAETIRITFEDGRRSREHPVGDFERIGVDAVFLSRSAVEKFLVPYYASLYGPDAAARVVGAFITAGFAVLAHLPQTEYVEVGAELPEAFGPGLMFLPPK